MMIDSLPEERIQFLYHFSRMQIPVVRMDFERFQNHLQRTFKLYQGKESQPVSGEDYLHFLEPYVLDWYICCSCLDNNEKAWQILFSLRTGKSDCLLIDALRARAVRLYPRDLDRQESVVNEFWSHLLVGESAGSIPFLARYDGVRPLAPWLIRVFQNLHISQLRSHHHTQSLPDEDFAMPLPTRTESETRWHDAFCQAAHHWLMQLDDQQLLLLGLRFRYRLTQREVAHLFGVHEGTISRQSDKLRDQFIEAISRSLQNDGWSGDDLQAYILTEMGALLLDEPRLSVNYLSALLAKRGKTLPSTASH